MSTGVCDEFLVGQSVCEPFLKNLRNEIRNPFFINILFFIKTITTSAPKAGALPD